MFFSSSADEHDNKNAEYELHISKLKDSVTILKGRLAGHKECRAERDLYRTFMKVLTDATDPDQLLKDLIDALAELLHARYAGIFVLDQETETFVYKFGKGYNPDLLPEIPRNQSAMGKCFKNRSIIWEQLFRDKADLYVDLKQVPSEYNLLLIPVFLFGMEMAVVRLANVDEAAEVTASAVMRGMIPVISAQLERLHLQERNEQAMKGLDVSFSIARLLENTLSEREIIQNICAKIPKLVPAKACLVALYDDDNRMRPLLSWPNGFHLGGNPQSELIYLRNLLEAWPDGSTIIADIHKDRRWGWAVQDIRALCMCPIRFRGTLRGLVIVLGQRFGETLDETSAKFIGLAATQASVTLERAAYFRRQEELASCDGLTGLFNHRMFQETIRSEIDRSIRYDRTLSMLMFDIDHFKKFNDTYGHPVGDEVIKMVARIAKSSGRQTDRTFRYGGEEFCVIMPETPVENATLLAERIRTRIESDRSVKGLSVTVSLGITQFRAGEKPETLIDRADQALYKSKESGRNRFTVL